MAAERARARREALEAAALADAAGVNDPVPGDWGGQRQAPLRPGPTRTYDGDWPPVEPRWLARYAAALFGAILIAFLAIFEGYPVYGKPWNLLWAFGGSIAALATAYYTLVYARRVGRRRHLVLVGGVGLLVVVCLAVGMFHTTEINGRAYLNSSPTARAYHLSLQMRSDLYAMAGYDVLLTDNVAAARAAYSQYAPAAARMDQLSAYYANLASRASGLPSPQFQQIAQNIADAAYWGAKALTAKANDIVQPDAANEANIASWRQTYVSDVLAAGPALGHLASLYGINITSGGPTE